jgi:CBS domain-containing protein
MSLRESLDRPVSEYMSEHFAKVESEDTVAAASKAMQKSGSTEAIVVKDGNPLGIVTERDILYKVVAVGSDPSKVKVREVMSSPVQTIEESSKVMDAISQMSRSGLRRLGVTRNGKLVGLVTQKAMVSGSTHLNVPLPELAVPGQLSCPYCGASMKSKEELSKHIDQVHLGLGLLEGDTTKW